jgi:hypothetical protein
MKKLWILIAAVVVVAVVAIAFMQPQLAGYRYTTGGNSPLNEEIDTRLVVSGFPEGDVIRGDVHHLRFYFQTLDMAVDSGRGIASPAGNLAVLIGYQLHRDSLNGPVMALGGIPSDYCEKNPTWTLDFGLTANIPGTYYLEVWSDAPAAGVDYEEQSMTLIMELV